MPSKRLHSVAEASTLPPNETGFFSKSIKKRDLLGELMKVHDRLSGLSQDPEARPEDIGLIASNLLNECTIDNKDNEVRLIVACCLVDILRIFAPVAPYNDEELLKVFRIIVAQLRCLGSSELDTFTGSKIFYILNSLSVVKSCVVMVYLAQSGSSDSEELYLSLIRAILHSARSDHSEEVVSHMISIVQSCIEESESIHTEILDCILQPLLPFKKTENIATYNLSTNILRRCSASLQGPMGALINEILVGSSSHSRVGSPEISEDIYALIYELHKVSADFLLTILPNICAQLQVDDEGIRLKAVKVLGKLFASRYADYGVHYDKNFKEFLGRFIDISSSVRIEMIDAATLIMRSKPHLCASIDDYIVKRLRDNDADVRLRCFKRLVEICDENSSQLKVRTYMEMIERVKDKKHEIRLNAMIGLSRLYSRHITSAFPPLNSEITVPALVSHHLDGDKWERLWKVPGALLSCWGYPETDVKHRVIQIIQEKVLCYNINEEKKRNCVDVFPEQSFQDSLPKFSDVSRSATAILVVFFHLNEAERKCFGSILMAKTKIGESLVSFVEDRRSMIKSPSNQLNARLQRGLHRLCTTLLPIAENKKSVIEKIENFDDKRVFSLFELSLSPLISSYDSYRYRKELSQRYETSSALGEYLGQLFDVSSCSIFNSCTIKDLIIRCYHQDSDDGVTCDLLSLFVKFFPKSFQGCIHELANLLKKAAHLARGSEPSHRSHLMDVLKITKKSAPYLSCSTCSEEVVSVQEEMMFSLLVAELYNQDDPYLREEFAYTINEFGRGKEKLLSKIDAVVNTLLSKSVTKMDVNKSVICNISALGALMTHSTFLNETSLEIVSQFVVMCLLKVEYSNNISESQLNSDIPISCCPFHISDVCCGLRCWGSMHISFEKKGHFVSDKTVNHILNNLLRILFVSIRSQGKCIGGLTLDTNEEIIICRGAVVRQLIELLEIDYVSKMLSNEHWEIMGWCFLDENASVRTTAVRSFSKLIQTTGLHVRFLAYASLAVFDQNCFQLIKKALPFALRRIRCTHDDLIGKAMEVDNLKVLALIEDVVPECIVPYAVYLLSCVLAQNTLVEGMNSWETKLKMITASLRFVYGSLKSSLREGSDNLSYLIQQLNLLSVKKILKIEDGTSFSTITRIAHQILHESIKTVENVQPFKGKIVFSDGLFSE